ncbi:hypothetical protein BH11PSE7_BH11PSE7_21820 [soil metagenome]
MNQHRKLFFLLGLLMATGLCAAAPAKPGIPIPAGTYHCIAGSSRMMLTLGDMKVSGTHYSFKAQGGPSTSGSYALMPKGYKWTGDIGAITNGQIVESGPDATPGDFWFSFKARPTSLPTTVACQRI